MSVMSQKKAGLCMGEGVGEEGRRGGGEEEERGGGGGGEEEEKGQLDIST